MVNTPKNKPVYSLDVVRGAAANDKVSYIGAKVRRDIGNLGYTFEDVVSCVMSLRSSDFVKSMAYGEGAARNLKCDVYDAQCASAEQDESDPIYLKLFVKEGTVYICSFHLPQ